MWFGVPLIIFFPYDFLFSSVVDVIKLFLEEISKMYISLYAETVRIGHFKAKYNFRV